MTTKVDALTRRRPETGFATSGKGGGKGTWGYSGYQSNKMNNKWSYGSYGQSKVAGKGYWGDKKYSDQVSDSPSMPLESGLAGLEDATTINEHVLKCATAVLENPETEESDMEEVLSKLRTLLTPLSPEAASLLAASKLPSTLVNLMKQYQEQIPIAATAAAVAGRLSGSPEATSALLRAGALDEVLAVMESHSNHGGMQNVCVLLLAGLLKDAGVIRQAVAAGAVVRVVASMGLTSGRALQLNGLKALQLLMDSSRHSRPFLQDNPKAPRAAVQEAALQAKVVYQADEQVCKAADELLALVTPRFKEVLCWHWQSGWCKLGPKCTYAHGHEDLRTSYAGGKGLGKGPAGPKP
mmetsp:Transcript_2952/g.5093  ORF Transcript_2952/g.5093 Transcript_2952/m.5093 type:complete len:353 (+) Transcript_2952:63-1121(+)